MHRLQEWVHRLVAVNLLCISCCFTDNKALELVKVSPFYRRPPNKTHPQFNKSGEVCLDSDPSPLPRGWERCLDLQSGVMYLKQMNTPSLNDNKANSRQNVHKRKRLLFEDDNGAGDPALQLSLSLPTCSFNSGDSYQTSPPQALSFSPKSTPAQTVAVPPTVSHDSKHTVACDNDSSTSNSSSASESHPSTMNGLLSLSQATANKEEESRRDATTSSNGSSPSCNASSSSSSSSPSYRQLGNERKGLRANQLGLGGLNQERNVIKATGCPHCFMYVLPSRNNPKCPRCKSPILVDLSPLTPH